MVWTELSFDPDSVASTSDVASSAMDLAASASDIASSATDKAAAASAAAATAAGKASDASSAVAARSAIWDKASAASSAVIVAAAAASDAGSKASLALGTFRKLGYDAQTGTFTVGNIITGATSGATAVIFEDTGTFLYLTNIVGTFQDDEIIYESALGDELIPDTTCATDFFDTKQTGWTHDAVNDEYDCDGSQPGWSYLMEAILSSGSFYKIVFTIKNYFAGNVFAYTTAQTGTYRTSDGTFTDYLIGGGGNPTRFYVYGDDDFIGSVDDISVKQITNAALVNGVLY